jgi:bacteriocin-like protein
MENLKELENSEMMQISGGVNLAYEIGYAIGSCVRQIILFKGLRSLI